MAHGSPTTILDVPKAFKQGANQRKAMSVVAPAQILSSLDPATGEVVGEVEVTPVDEIPAIVARAKAAQEGWGRLDIQERIEHLTPAAEALSARTEELGELVTREMGKPLRDGIAEVRRCSGGLAAELEEMKEALAPEALNDGRIRSIVYRDPYGVCAAITPWNFPLAMPHWMVLPALVAGNAVVLKPSEETPLSGQAYADALNETLPKDVLQVVHGADDQGRALVAADVDLIAFTGSREVGKEIHKAASGSLKRVILELGGKDPMIVLEDADLDAAAEFAAWNSFRNAGQVCVSTERIFVPDSVAAEFESLLAARASALQVGNGLDDATGVGPMVNVRQRDHVIEQVREAVDGGARVLAGSTEPQGPYVEPTVLTGVSDEMSIARDETFGPVACVTRVASVDEAVARANDTPFGLGAVVFGRDEAAEAVARRLTAGMIGVNQGCFGASGVPWVGARESGYSFHKSKEGHRNFTQPRVVSRPAAS